MRGAHWDVLPIPSCVPRLASRRENARGMFRGNIPDRCSRRITIELSAPRAGAMTGHFIVHGCAPVMLGLAVPLALIPSFYKELFIGKAR